MKQLRYFYTALMLATAGVNASAQTALPQTIAASSAQATAVTPSMHRTVAVRDTLWNISRDMAAGSAVTRHQVMLAVLRKNPDAFVDGSVFKMKVGSLLTIPTPGEIEAEDPERADAFFLQQERAGTSRRHLVPVLPQLNGAHSRGTEGDSARLTEKTADSAGSVNTARNAVDASGSVPASATATGGESAPQSQADIKSQASAKAQASADPVAPSGWTDASALQGSNLLWPVLLGILGVLGVGGAVLVLRRRAPQASGLRASSGMVNVGKPPGEVTHAAARQILEPGASFELVRRRDANDANDANVNLRPTLVDLELAAACLETGRLEQARARLRNIIESGEGDWRERAQALLIRLAKTA